MDEKKIRYILGNYSPESQITQAIQELSELSTELTRMLLGKGDRKRLISELADVYIMTSQIGEIFDIKPAELDEEVEYKLDRQIRRIREEEQ